MSTATARRPQRGAPPPRRRIPILAIVGGLVVLLAVVAVIVTSIGGDDDDATATTGAGGTALEQTRPVAVEGEALAPRTDPADDTAVGTAAPTVEGQAFDGTPVTVGGPKELVLFVAHWCPHCRAEVPVITQWLGTNPDLSGVRLVAVSTGVNGNAPNFPPSDWLAREHWPIETMADDADGTAGNAFGLTAYPFFVAIGSDGNVAARASGELTIDQLEALVAAAAG
jgi:thiol-disulfide isomerase/thioredoxin